MKIQFQLQEGLFDCAIRLYNPHESHEFMINALEADSNNISIVDVDVNSSDFLLTITALPSNKDGVLDELELTTFFEKIIKKAFSAIFSAMDKAFLYVCCNYRLENLKDGDIITIESQGYAFGTFDRFDLLELLPMIYIFYDVSVGGKRPAFQSAFGINRKEVIRFVKKLALIELLTYPLQVGRIKYLSSRRKVNNTLKRFHNMNEAQRQKILKRMEC